MKPDDLLPGDILLYWTPGLVGDAIMFGEGMTTALNPVSHVEIYSGLGKSWASRDGIGVNEYPYRSDGLVSARRPVGAFNQVDAQTMFHALRAVGYGNGDNAAHAGIEHYDGGLNCSHFATVLLKAAGVPQFADDFSARLITPSDFLKSRAAVTL